MTTTALASNPVERIDVTYTCVSDHTFTRTFVADIDVPSTWDCPRCGKLGTTGVVQESESGAAPSARTHWDMLLERRSMDELASMVADRITDMRAVRPV
ncbi:MAG: RNA polymerase-binding protein RbpA [Propionibacteriaceae bacterium]|nr:RNA polymerase-binding protein RbpA [Propionibacteriaceae bacterium]